jgi:hypothetical protein
LLAFAAAGARTPIAKPATMAAIGILMLLLMFFACLLAGPCLPCRCPVEPVLPAPNRVQDTPTRRAWIAGGAY